MATEANGMKVVIKVIPYKEQMGFSNPGRMA